MTARGQKILNMVLAVLVAVGSWIFVIVNYDPMTDITYSDVPVTFVGEDALAQRGLAVAETDVEGISVTLNQRRTDTSRLKAEDISVTADLSDCVAGDNYIELKVSGPYDTTVEKYDTSSVEVSVGRAKSAEMDIDVAYADEIEENEEPIAFDLSLAVANVTCTADRLEEIDKVVALLKRENVGESRKSYTVDLAAMDDEGNIIPHVLISPEEISLDACEGYTKEVSLSIPVKTESDDDYDRKYIVPETVTIKGSQEAIDKIGTVRALEVDISDIYEDTEIPLKYNLPDNIYIADESRGQVMKVTVTRKEDE